MVMTTGLLAGLVGMSGLLAGGAAGLILGGPRRFAAALKRGVGWAAVGAIAGGLGPVLVAATGGWLSAAGGTIIACSIAGLIAAVVGYAFHSQPPDPDGAVPRAADRASWRVMSAAGWAAAAFVVAAAACASRSASGDGF